MVVAVKVFKKTTPNGKVTFYLGRRDFIDHLDYCDPIDGVVVVDKEYLKGRKVFGELVTTYRYGREEDEVMGVKFSKELSLQREQIVPLINKSMEMTPLQERLIKKLGENAYPFTFQFPNVSPSSVTLQAGEDDEGKPLGVEYTIKAYVGQNEEDKAHKRSQVSLTIKKLQYAPASRGRRLPSSLVSKGFTFSQGKINLEVTLDREIYYHGEKVAATVVITNNSRKTVKNIKCYVVQHCEVSSSRWWWRLISFRFDIDTALIEFILWIRSQWWILNSANMSHRWKLVKAARLHQAPALLSNSI